MAHSAADIRAKLLEEAKKAERNSTSGGDGASYPFWNLQDNTSATIRFLEDGNKDNIFFWVERLTIKLKFQGVVGDHDKETIIPVPCVEMFGETCPIISTTRPWWKDPAKEDLARQYWKKKTYIFQGFVVHSPLVEDNAPENPIRRFVINPSIFEIVKNSLVNPEMEDNPTDFEGGRDFKLTKTKKGDYANYTTSQWSFKTRSLSQNERIAVEQFGLRDLGEFKGRRPGKEEMEVIKAMFQDSVAGRPFDTASYGTFYRPWGSAAPSTDTKAEPATQVVSVDQGAGGGAFATPSGSGKPPAHEILERIKNRTLNK